MKITGVETFVVGTFHKNARRHWLLLKLLTDEGLYGLGDASLHAYDAEIESIVRQWVDRYLVGQDPLHHERHWTRLYQDTPARGGAPRQHRPLRAGHRPLGPQGQSPRPPRL